MLQNAAQAVLLCGKTSRPPPFLARPGKRSLFPPSGNLFALTLNRELVYLCPAMGCGLHVGRAHAHFPSAVSGLAPGECKWNSIKPNLTEALGMPPSP